ncbi:hypothetical protein [Thermococcus sp. JCM 11816]|uniref:hypothetical protein n=1 Tax=Thermococcus sp. (strain JCM 11816 / KS-1) TaxID=1295125 RepID=UPI000B299860
MVYQGVERNSIYYACSTGKTARIYYHNGLLEFTDCPEYRGKHKGVVELPLREFIEDVLEISREYLEKYASIIDRILIENEHNPGDDYEYLLNFYQEVKKMYEKPSCGSSSLSKKEHWA